MSYTVTVLDTGAIQSFIFGSNELRENIGASQLVYWATRDWTFEALNALVGPRHNIDLDGLEKPAVPYVDDFHIEKQTEWPAAEVVYAGGGNTVIIFRAEDSLSLAKEFTYQLSARILHEAPGLALYAAHEPYEWNGETSLPATIFKAMGKLGRYKATIPAPLPALSFSVSASCTSTGLPATGSHPDSDKKGTLANRASEEVRAKWRAAGEATKRLRALFPEVTGKHDDRFRWTDDLDRLANLPSRNDSYIAVVHADGNGMGRRIRALNLGWGERPQQTREYVVEMRRLSSSIAQTSTEALAATINALVKRLLTREGSEQLNAPWFPFRPIVFGGDDVAWVCAGPWGVSLAHRYLTELEKQTIGDWVPYAAAGVAIVKTHFPFSQAYVISEELASEAKARVREVRGEQKDASALDWHYTTSGISGDLKQIRQREYTTPTGDYLHMRPVLLGANGSWRTWDNFSKAVMAFRYKWLNRHNKVMALRDALRGGRPAARQFVTLYGEELPPVNAGTANIEYGWAEDEDGRLRSSHYDAVELSDMFFELPTSTEERQQ